MSLFFQESHGNDLGFGDAQSNAECNLFDGLDQASYY